MLAKDCWLLLLKDLKYHDLILEGSLGVTYYEEIQLMSCASRRPKPKLFKHTMIVDEGAAGGNASL